MPTQYEGATWQERIKQLARSFALMIEELIKVAQTELEQDVYQADAKATATGDTDAVDGEASNDFTNKRTAAGAKKAGAKAETKDPEVIALEQRASAAESKLIEVQQRFNDLRHEMQRETENLRARLQRGADEKLAAEKSAFVQALLPVMDNFNRAIEAAASGSSPEQLLNGLRGTASGFENALAQIGVEPVKSVGETFDPELHEAVDTVEHTEDDVITNEYARGYRLGNRLLRPARVQVGKKS